MTEIDENLFSSFDLLLGRNVPPSQTLFRQLRE